MHFWLLLFWFSLLSFKKNICTYLSRVPTRAGVRISGLNPGFLYAWLIRGVWESWGWWGYMEVHPYLALPASAYGWEVNWETNKTLLRSGSHAQWKLQSSARAHDFDWQKGRALPDDTCPLHVPAFLIPPPSATRSVSRVGERFSFSLSSSHLFWAIPMYTSRSIDKPTVSHAWPAILYPSPIERWRVARINISICENKQTPALTTGINSTFTLLFSLPLGCQVMLMENLCLAVCCLDSWSNEERKWTVGERPTKSIKLILTGESLKAAPQVTPASRCDA